MKRNPLLAGTLLLTAAGFVSRILGFFYRIFLSRTIGAEGLGIYQMIFPIHGIAFAICCGPIQTSISRMASADVKKGRSAFRTGLAISLCLSLSLMGAIYAAAEPLARYVLLEPRCAPLLPVMALSIPFSAIHACICGYYYGLKKTAVPAFSQLIEQLIRIGAVFLIAHVAAVNKRPISVSLAVWGMLIGEAGSAVFSFLFYSISTGGKKKRSEESGDGEEDEALQEEGMGKKAIHRPSFFSIAGPLMAMALPLMGNRLILNCLQSLEAIFVPNKLMAFGLGNSESLSLYGVLTGMALPFILFPSAITNSLAVILLPTVSEAQALGNQGRIQRTIAMALRYSLYMGILCIGVFTLFGDALGQTVYRNEEAGSFITVLAWLCPFMYLSTTMGSILNGLGKTSSVFLHTAISMLITLSSVVFWIPSYGIYAYLGGLLLSELVLAFLHIHTLSGAVPVRLNLGSMLMKPALCLAVAIGILRRLEPYLEGLQGALPTEFLFVMVQAGILSALSGGGLLVLHRGRSERSGAARE